MLNTISYLANVGFYFTKQHRKGLKLLTFILLSLSFFAGECLSPAPTKFTITFNSNEGSAVASITVTSGNKATKPTDPTRANYVFVGWYKETELTTAFNFDTETITANITLYAKWAITYTVTFNSNEGSAVASITVTSGNKATKPTDPTRANYVFVGWYKDPELTTAFNFDTETITANITLYAKWAIAVTSIAFDKTTLSETYIGKKIQITATVSPANAANKYLTWTSSNETVASVTTDGLITTLAKGDATITATSKDGSKISTSVTVNVGPYFYIPDANFRNKLKGIAAANKTSWFSNIDDKENVLDITKANEFTGTLDVKSSDIANLSGIEYFTAITNLYCYSNQLTSLDVSKNAALTNLWCNSNLLKSLDVSNNVDLTILYCNGNQLKSLDVSNNVDLTTLWCFSNLLTSLDVSKNVRLKTLWCNENQLTSLDLRGMRSSSVSGLKITTGGAGTNNSGLTSIKIHKSVGIITSAVNTELKEVKKLATSVQIDVYDGEGTNASPYTHSICDYNPDTGDEATNPRACK
ncbi:hypothetical protein CHS0354_024166 [Potamilus streckersoni]|uniref:BIG2 domain-containing protein n=1 Tax=Potamilus streckersoni TaxID=2493646 RepID=A0AAE0RZP5_9BIVA|nr:hypothetical protein CHS0354_024166 [Potamilus streckersoni]